MTASQPSQVARRIIYVGRVQGVGFRYTTATIAQRHPVNGWVRNCRDGTVELFAQGSESAIDQFLHDVDAAFPDHISDRRIDEAGVDHLLTSFEIRR